MTIEVQFLNRDFSHYVTRHWDSIQVKKYSKSSVGGPLQATFDVYGSEDDTWKFIEMLRCPVNLIDEERSEEVWWGYISRVDVYSVSGVHYGIDIESMSNRLAVAYTYNFERETTAWASDADSVSEYGTKELLLSSNDKTADQAVQYRDSKLDAIKYPVQLPIAFGKTRQTAMARVTCRGWLATLAWKYYDNEAGKVAYEEIETSCPGRRIGRSGFAAWCAQSFKTDAANNWDATHISVRLRKVGSPTDSLELTLRANNVDEPGASLRSSTPLASGDMTEYWEWYEFELTSAYELVTGTTYWIRVQRTGALDEDNHYEIDGTETDGYQDGEFNVWMVATSNWARYYDVLDANFRVIGLMDTTDQIELIVDEGEFFESTDIEATSGVGSYPYRNGDSLALYELEELLKVGTANDRRFIATVTKNRFFRVYEEPIKGDEDYFINKEGIVTNQYDKEVHLAYCPVAYWVQLKDVVPVSVDVSKLSSATRLFVEQAEYDVVKKTYRITQARDSTMIPEPLAELKGHSISLNKQYRYVQG